MKKFGQFALYMSSIALAVGIGMFQVGGEIEEGWAARPDCTQVAPAEKCLPNVPCGMIIRFYDIGTKDGIACTESTPSFANAPCYRADKPSCVSMAKTTTLITCNRDCSEN